MPYEEQVKKVNTGSSRNMLKMVPQTTGENRTLLELQLLKRKRAKRIDGVESNELIQEQIAMASQREQLSPTPVGLKKECPVSYVQKEFDLEKGVSDNSIAPVTPTEVYSDSVTSDDCHTGLTQDIAELVISGSYVRADQEVCLLEDGNTGTTNISSCGDEKELESRIETINVTSNNQCPLASEVLAPENLNLSYEKGDKLQLSRNKHAVDSGESVKLNSLVWGEDFAEVLLQDEWVKVEIVSRDRISEGVYVVRRIDNSGHRFEVEAQGLTRFGSHDPKSERQIKKAIERDRIKELLKKQGCTIEEIEGDGNCLFGAVARQVYGDSKKFQKVRDEVVNHIIAHRSYFSSWEPDIDGRLSEQLMNHSWGGHLEIQAISEFYNVGIVVWQLSEAGELVSSINNTPLAATKGLESIYLVRLWSNHYDCVVFKKKKFP